MKNETNVTDETKKGVRH